MAFNGKYFNVVIHGSINGHLEIKNNFDGAFLYSGEYYEIELLNYSGNIIIADVYIHSQLIGSFICENESTIIKRNVTQDKKFMYLDNNYDHVDKRIRHPKYSKLTNLNEIKVIFKPHISLFQKHYYVTVAGVELKQNEDLTNQRFHVNTKLIQSNATKYFNNYTKYVYSILLETLEDTHIIEKLT